MLSQNSKIDANSIDKTVFSMIKNLENFLKKESPTKIIEHHNRKDNIENNSVQNKVAEKVFWNKPQPKLIFGTDLKLENQIKFNIKREIIVSNPEFKLYKEVFKKALSFGKRFSN